MLKQTQSVVGGGGGLQAERNAASEEPAAVRSDLRTDYDTLHLLGKPDTLELFLFFIKWKN